MIYYYNFLHSVIKRIDKQTIHDLALSKSKLFTNRNKNVNKHFREMKQNVRY